VAFSRLYAHVCNGVEIDIVFCYDENMIEETLQTIADEVFTSTDDESRAIASRYASKAQFRDGLEKVYALIANRTCQNWVRLHGSDLRITEDEFFGDLPHFLFDLEPSYVSSDEFQFLVGSHRLNGKKRKVPYAVLVDVLKASEIIHVNESYKVGERTKSYSLNHRFMARIIGDCLKAQKDGDCLNVYECFMAYYPNRLLESKIKKARQTYEGLSPQDGIRLKLPSGWYKQISIYGWFTFDEELTIDKLLSDMRTFTKQRKGNADDDRVYDWFTGCSAAFRKYLYVGTDHYRELIDCHSGIFWMFSLHGFEQGRIGGKECMKMINHCFSGTFYTDVSGRPKTREVKQMFMKVMNMTTRQQRYMMKNLLFVRIKKCLAVWYPEMTKYLDELRSKKKLRKNENKIGRYNHYQTISIEKKIMDELKKKLEEMGYHHLHRVHDAIYGIQDVPNIESILYNVILDYYNKILYKIAA